MKRIFSTLLLFLLICSQFQVLPIYAEWQAQLEWEKQKSVATLDAIEQVVDGAVGKIEKKIRNKNTKKQLQEKNEEIKEYLDDVVKDIKKESSSEDIKEKVEEAKKVVVLKVVSGTTQYENVEKNISSDVAKTSKDKKEAAKTIQDSLKSKNGDYSIIIRTKYSKSKVKKLFETFDPTIKLEKMYDLGEETYFEVFIDKDSIFRKEMLEDIESGILPETFIGIKIVLPEVYGISEISLAGEDLTQTWGIEQYQSFKYFESINEASKKIRVGVVDTGIDYNHPDLSQNVNQELGKDFVNEDDDAWDDQWHGTHVAGTIAANVNGSGIIWVNPYVELVPLKICTDSGFCPSYGVIRALEYAREQKIDILNMSLGGRGTVADHPICAGISSVVESGGIVVAASGNSNIDTSRFVPGGCSDAITVAAVDENGMRAPFSNYGAKVDVAAPGVGVYSTYPMNKWGYKKLSGTSMATPHVVWLVSLIEAYKPGVSAQEVKGILQEYSSPVQTDTSSKPIAQAVDLQILVASFASQVVEEEVIEEIVEEEITQSGSVSKYAEREGFESIGAEIGDTTIPEVSDAGFMIEDAPEMKDVLQVLDFDLWNEDEESIEINTLSGSVIEEALDVEVKKEDFYISSGNKSFDGNGKKLDGNTQINSGEEALEWKIESVGENFDFQNISELSDEVYMWEEDAGVEINNVTDEVEIQDILIDGAEKWVKINSAEEELWEEFVFTSGWVEEEVLYDEEGNIIDVSQLEENEIIEDSLDFTMDEEVFIDGAEASVEINSAETSTGELIEVPEFSTDMIVENLQEEIPEWEIFEIIETESERIESFEETKEVTFEWYEPEWVEINNLEEEIEEEVVPEIYREWEENIVYYEELDSWEIMTPEDFEDEEDGIGEDEIIEGTYEEYREWEEEFEEEGTMGIQNTYSCNIKPGQSCSFSIYKSYRYDFKKENPDVSTHSSSKRNLYIYGKNPWTSTYKLYRYGRHYHTIYVTVQAPPPPPEPLEYDINVLLGKETYVYVQDRDVYGFSVENHNTGKVWVYQSSKRTYVRIYGIQAGDSDIYVRGREGYVKYIIRAHVVTPPPPVYETSVYEGRNIYIKGNSAYEITSSQDDGVEVFAGSSNIKVTGKSVWTLELYFKKNGIHEYTYKIEVKAIPEPKVYDVKILEWLQTTLYFPRGSYRIYKQAGASGRVSVSARRGYSSTYIYIRWYEEGKQQYYVYDDYGFHKYTLNIDVTIKEPVIKNISVYEGKYISLGECRYSNLYGQPDGITRYYKYGRYCYAQALKVGDTEILMKSYNWWENYLYKIEVKGIPTPKEYDTEIKVGGELNVYLPEDISQYEVSYEWDNIFDRTQKFEKHFYFKTERVWEWKMILRNQDGYIVYVVNIRSITHYREYSIHLSDRYYNNPPSSYSYRSQNNSIAYQSGDYLLGRSVGEVEIHVSNSYGLREIWKITVLPKPEPKVIECEITVWEQCNFADMRRTGQYLYQSKSGMLDINWYRSSIKVEGEASGTAKIYIRSRSWDYISHILQITVHPVPPTLKTMTMMEWSTAETSKWIKEGYSYKVSKPGMLSISRLYNSSRSDRQWIKLTALAAGEVDLYVYELGDHTRTYRITIFPRNGLSFPESSVTVGEGKEIKIALEGGYAPYSVVGFNEKYTDVDVSKLAGVVEISGVKKSSTYATVEDKYGQRASVQVNVLESKIETDVSELTLAPGETGYISVTNYVWAVRQLFRRNNNIKSYLESFIEDGERVYKIRVEALYSWDTSMIFRDYKKPVNNHKSITVRITGDVQNPDFKVFRHPDEIDGCPNGDYSWSNNDGKCGAPPPVVEEEIPVEENADLDETLQQDIEKDIQNIFALLWIEINADQSIEQWDLASKLPDEIIRKADAILYEKVKSKLENTSHTNAIQIYERFIDTFHQKEKEYLGKKKTLASYIRVTFEIFKVERQSFQKLDGENEVLKKQIIEWERELLKNNYELEKRIQEFKKVQWRQEWFNQAVEDYITSYVELADITEIAALIKGIANIDLENVSASVAELYEIYVNLNEILAWLEEETREFYKSYIKTTLALSAIPVKLDKVNKFKGKSDSKTYKEIQELKKKKDEWFTWVKYIPDVRVKIEGKIDHIVKVNLETDNFWNTRFTWVHSMKAVLEHPYGARIELDNLNIDDWTLPYTAKVFANDKNGKEILKSWWNGRSTFFPNSWSKEKIMDEVEHAIKNNEGKAFPSWSTREQNIYKWFSKDWELEINFVIYEWKLETFYPVIK